MFKKNHLLLYLILMQFVSVFSQKNSDKIMHPAPVIAWSVSNLCFGDTSYFSNSTTGEITDSWTIYEETSFGEILLKQDSSYNTKYLFLNPGNFRVELNSDNGHLVTLSRYLRVDTIPHADFDYQDCNSQFTNLSSCFTSCFWDFGDGFTSTQTSPTHFYQVTGTYTIKLKVFKGSKIDSTEYDINIFNSNSFLGTFKYTIEPDSVLFTADDSTGGVYVQYHWAFGDGNTADLNGSTGGKKIRHYYPNIDSTYYVFLLVKTFCSFAYSQQALHINGPYNSNNSGGPTLLFPNPINADGQLYLSSGNKSEISEIKLIDCLGQTINNVPILTKPFGFELDLSTLSQGVYIIQIYFPNQTITQRIIR